MTKDTGPCNNSAEEFRAIWFAVFIVEFTMIFLINVVTIITFARNRHLRKRSTYLIMNLTVADLLVGAVTGPLHIASYRGCTLVQMIIEILKRVSPISSVVNLSLIALERVHATVYPFRHCLIEKWFYFKIIICGWLLALILACVDTVLYLCLTMDGFLLKTSVSFLTLLLVIVCNVLITVNIKRNPRPHPSSAVASERKLTVTLIIVSVLSLLTILPRVVYRILRIQSTVRLSSTTELHSLSTFLVCLINVFFFFNSIVNPVIYAIRLQEFRKAVRELVCKNYSAPASLEPIELNEM